MKVLKIEGWSDGRPCVHEGRYLKSMEFDPVNPMIPIVESTDDKETAMQFDNAMDALEFWKSVNPNYPVRPDGKPNRPLTAYTVSV